MNAKVNRQIVLASRPTGEPRTDNFRLIETPLPLAGAGEVLLETLFLSLDPYMRGRMSAAKSYAPPIEIGGWRVGGAVSRVLKPHHADYKPGNIVQGRTGWQSHAMSDGAGLQKVDPALAPISTALGVLGMPGMTAYTGLLNLGQPKPGETYRADLGVLRGSNHQTTQRVYWSNKATAITSDVPSEAELTPGLWGKWKIVPES